jgi:hypothetical protein
MAREYGIDGFCYYHYWFNGKTLMHKPLQEIIKSGKPDFPFMLCWANDNWTRRWDGLDQEILIKHNYNDYDDEEHIKYLFNFFKDKRYITIDGKPIFILYKPFLLPNPTETANKWRKIALLEGFELYLCHMVFGYQSDEIKLIEGFDAVIDFEPFGIRRRSNLKRVSFPNQESKNLYSRVKNKLFGKSNIFKIPNELNVFDYASMYENLVQLNELGLKMYPSVVPGWDNSPRRKLKPSLILHESTPKKYGEWLEKVINDFVPYSNEENFIFINAWNEWAEGNHLEPCMKWGRSYLEETQRILKNQKDNLD